MALITFEDLPSTNTPINASNLNNNFNELNNKNDYFATEQVVGKWINGKPIYRQVIVSTTPASLNTNAQVGSLNCAISNVIKLDAFVGVTNTVWVPVPQYLANTIYNYLYLENCNTVSNLTMLVVGNNYISKPIIIIAEYTKAAD